MSQKEDVGVKHLTSRLLGAQLLPPHFPSEQGTGVQSGWSRSQKRTLHTVTTEGSTSSELGSLIGMAEVGPCS